MGGGFENRADKASLAQSGRSTSAPAVGKRPLTGQVAQDPRPGPHPVEWLLHGPDAGDPVQRKAVEPGYGDLVAAAAAPVQRSASASTKQVERADGPAVQQAAAWGITDRGSSLPHADTIQRLFGRHDVSGIEAHVGGPAATASRAIDAEAYATGRHIAFASAPSLHTAAHEAAHVVQQRGGVQLKGGIGERGDVYEQHADQVADAVVQGKSAEELLDRYAVSSPKCPACGAATDGDEACPSCGGAPEMAPPSAPAHAIQRSPASERNFTDGAAALQQLPRSLHQTLDPSALSDDAIAAEIGAIRAWFNAQSASSKESEPLALALGQLAHELVTRHPGPSIPATPPRPANSITPADVRRASAGAVAGVTAAGAGMAVGLAPMPPPVTMPPPLLELPLAPPVAAPPVAAPPPLPAPTPPVAPAPRPVPVAPIAAGVLVFLIVLLWPNDSIESGAEERRKLDEYERRRRQQTPNPSPVEATGPTPEPAPSPAPRPVPPVGTAPHERRLPNQTCENQVLDALQKAMHDVCDRIPGESCSPGKVNPKKLAKRPCSQIRLRIQAIRECLRLRQKIQDECFSGAPDPAHANVLSDFQRGLAACLALEAVNCMPGHPMADL